MPVLFRTPFLRRGFALLGLVLATLPPVRSEDRPVILGISHVVVRTTDIAKSLGYYRDFLGFAVEGDWQHLGDSSPLPTTFLKVSDDQWIELIADPARTKENRVSSVVFRVKSAAGMRDWLAAQGMSGLPATVAPDELRNLEFAVRDPHGYSVGFVEYIPDSLTAQSRGKFLPSTRISSHIKHLGIAVDDLKADQDFYIRALGFKESWRGAADPKQLSWIHQRVPDGGDFVEWMLLPPVLPHFCLEVSNMAEAQAQLERSPAFAAYGRKLDMHVGKNRKRQVNLFDPDGTRTELMEPDTIDGKPTPPSTAPLPPRLAAAAQPG